MNGHAVRVSSFCNREQETVLVTGCSYPPAVVNIVISRVFVQIGLLLDPARPRVAQNFFKTRYYLGSKTLFAGYLEDEMECRDPVQRFDLQVRVELSQEHCGTYVTILCLQRPDRKSTSLIAQPG